MEDGAAGGVPFVAHSIAGASAGVAEHVAMFPLDTLKTRMQAGAGPGAAADLGGARGAAARPEGSAAAGACSASVASTAPRACAKTPPAQSHGLESAFKKGKHGGSLVNLYRGVGPVAFAAGPVHAIYFATYEAAKHALVGEEDAANAPLRVALAGASATLAADFAMNPVDVIKQRMQLCDSPYRSALECVRCVVRTEGLGALWRSYPLTAATNVPFTCVYFTAYESAKAMLDASGTLGGGESPAAQCVAGGIAGGLAAAATTPLDVVKTRIQTFGEEAKARMALAANAHPAAPGNTAQGALPRSGFAASGVTVAQFTTSAAPSAVAAPVSIGAGAALRLILKEDGARGLLRGLLPRVLFHVPAAAISWTVYESCKAALLARQA